MSLTDRPPIPFQRSPNRFPVLRRRFHYGFLDPLLNEPFRQSSQLLRVAPVPAPLKLKLVTGFNVSHHNGQPFLVNIDSRNPIGHRHSSRREWRACRAYINLGRGLSPLRKGATHHLFARSRTLRIKLTFGLRFSNVISISPLPAV